MRKYSGCYPGAGVGGHCLTVDPYYPVKKAEECLMRERLLEWGGCI